MSSGVLARLSKAWDDLRAEHGSFRSLERVGAWVEGSYSRVGLRVRFENGTDSQIYLWAGDRLAGVSNLEQLPKRAFEPFGPVEFAALDPNSLTVTRVRFEALEDETRRLVFASGQDVAVRCRPDSARPPEVVPGSSWH